MKSLTDIEQLRLCAVCIKEEFLRAEIEQCGEPNTCDYCGKDGMTISIGELAVKTNLAFESHYQRTETEQHGVLTDCDSRCRWERQGYPVVSVICDAVEIKEEPAEDIRKVLDERHWDFDDALLGEEAPFDEEAHYTGREPDDSKYLKLWNIFEASLNTKARYFSGEDTLHSVFKELVDLHGSGDPALIEVAGPQTNMKVLYRARVFQSDDKLEKTLCRPDVCVAPPPASKALAGRMNAHGISVFYGATQCGVAIDEVRPPVGSNVVLGRFELLRPIRLFNVDALRTIRPQGSLFDPNYIDRLNRAKFLRTLSCQITKPVMPNDEPFDYLATQVIAEYLAHRSDLALDGILYPSAQSGASGCNVMLFHEASRVEVNKLPEGTCFEFRSRYFDGEFYETFYEVVEKVPAAKPEDSEKEAPGPFSNSPILCELQENRDDSDSSEATLRLDFESLRVHHVTAVKFTTQEHPVHRSRCEKSSGR